MKPAPQSAPHIVLTVHGIRTFGQWQKRLGDLLTKSDSNIALRHYKFNYFSVLAFMIPFVRWVTTRRFMRELRKLKHAHPTARIDIVAHSFGTHLVGWGLQRLSPAERPRIHTIILAGSVLRPSFHWNDLLDSGDVHRVINECGLKDGILVLNQLVVLFTGMAGRVGFAGMTSDRFMNRYYRVGHSGYFQSKGRPSNQFMSRYWVPLLTGTAPPKMTDEREPSALQGFFTFLLQNSEPIKLAFYIILLLTPALVYRNLYNTASSREWAVKAILNLPINPEESIKSALQAIGYRKTEEAEDALRQSLFESHLRLKLSGHGDNVRSAEFSRDGQFVLTASDDGKASVWNASTGALLASLEHASKVNRAKFSPDGTLVVTASDDNTAQVWAAKTGERINKPLEHKGHVNTAEFSRDGQFVITASDDGTAQIADVKTGQPLASSPLQHGSDVSMARFGLDDTAALTVGGNRVRLWDVKTGTCTFEVSRDKTIRHAAISPDGRLIVAACDDMNAYIWDVKDPKQPLRELQGHTKIVISAEFSPDGKTIVTGSDDGTARLWAAGTGKLLFALYGHTGPVKSAQFSPNGKWVVTRSYDNTAKVYEVQTGNVIAELRGHSDAVRCAVFSPDSTLIVTASNDKTARVWQLSTESLQADLPHERQVLDASFSSNGAFAITSSLDSTAQVWRVAANQTWQRHGKPIKHDQAVTAASISAEGNLALSVNASRIAQLWELDADNEWHTVGDAKPHVSPFLDTSVDAGGNFIAASIEREGETDRHKVQVWKVSAQGWRESGEAFTVDGEVISAPFSRDGKLRVVIYNGNNQARIWAADRTGGWREEGDALRHTDGIYGAAFSKDGKRVVTSSFDRTARVWEVGTGQRVAELRGHDDWLNSAAFSPDGAFVVTTSRDRTARVWEIRTSKEVARLSDHTDYVNQAVFDSSAKRIVTASKDGHARIYACEVCSPLDDIRRLARKRIF